LKEEADGLALVIEGMLDHATARSNASPAADEAGLAEQRFLDRQRIEPGHVLIRVMPFDVEPIVLRDHDEQNRATREQRPMTGLNHLDADRFISVIDGAAPFSRSARP
jgi:hypothetical protein